MTETQELILQKKRSKITDIPITNNKTYDKYLLHQF